MVNITEKFSEKWKLRVGDDVHDAPKGAVIFPSFCQFRCEFLPTCIFWRVILATTVETTPFYSNVERFTLLTISDNVSDRLSKPVVTEYWIRW